MRKFIAGSIICLILGVSFVSASELSDGILSIKSNVQIAATLEVSPDTLFDTLLTGGTSTQSITLSNLDTLTQTFDIVVDYA